MRGLAATNNENYQHQRLLITNNWVGILTKFENWVENGQKRYSRNVVQQTQFGDSFLFLGFTISNSKLVFFTLIYLFDTEYTDSH